MITPSDVNCPPSIPDTVVSSDKILSSLLEVVKIYAESTRNMTEVSLALTDILLGDSYIFEDDPPPGEEIIDDSDVDQSPTSKVKLYAVT